MGPGHVWLAERTRELDSLRAIIAALEAGRCPGAVRGAGVPARPGRPVPVTIGNKPQEHGHARLSQTGSPRCARPRPPNATPPSPAPKPGSASSTKAGQPVTFRAVAAAGGVSVDFLYRHPGLRARIERLRGHKPAPAGHAPPGEPGNPAASSVVATLTARLTELRRELAETKAQLAAAHGELLALRRHPGNDAPGDRSAACRPRRRHVKDASSTT